MSKDEKALDEQKAKAVAVYNANPMADFNFDDDPDFRPSIPVYKIEYLAQEMPTGFQKGKISIIVGGNPVEQVDSLRFVWLTARKTRAVWPKFNPANPNIEALCKSDDGFAPTGGAQMRGVESCAKCKDSQWGKTGEPPACAAVYTILGFDLNANRPFIMSFKRTSLQPLKTYYNDVKSLVAAEAMMGDDQRKWSYPGLSGTASIETELKIRTKANYFVPILSKAGRLDRAKSEMFTKLAGEMKGVFSRFSVEEATGSVEGDEESF